MTFSSSKYGSGKFEDRRYINWAVRCSKVYGYSLKWNKDLVTPSLEEILNFLLLRYLKMLRNPFSLHANEHP